MAKILSALRSVGHTVYCSIEDKKWFQENNKTNRDILDHALEKHEESDVVLVFVRSDQKSEGMLLEVGYTLAREPLLFRL